MAPQAKPFYAHETRSEILCRTLVSILQDLPPRPQSHMKNSPSMVPWPECQPNPVVDCRVSRFEPRFEPWARFDYDSDGSVRYGEHEEGGATK